ncbi:MAG: FecR domain-containing protein [Clostridia bacterium]
MKKFLSCILACLFLFTGLCTPVLAATTTATAFRLEMTEGTVTVKNATGREITVRDGGRLYNGYEVSTEAGYAWLSLDNDKILKLDYNTKITLKKSGNDLEIMIESGNVFFDVQKPLESNETLTIRTSNMNTGVRGTIGVASANYVKSTDTNKQIQNSSIILFEGSLEVISKGQTDEHPNTVSYITAGEKIIVSQEDAGTAGVETETTIISAKAEEGLEENPFVAIEVAKDDTLRERIEIAQEESDLTEVLEIAETLLAQKEEETITAMEEVDTQVSETVEEIISTEETSDDTTVIVSSSDDDDDDDDTVETKTVTLTYYYDAGLYIFYTSEQTVGDVVALPSLIPVDVDTLSGGCWTYDDVAVTDETVVVDADMSLYWVAID